jgi:hypothetical protein
MNALFIFFTLTVTVPPVFVPEYGTYPIECESRIFLELWVRNRPQKSPGFKMFHTCMDIYNFYCLYGSGRNDLDVGKSISRAIGKHGT